MRNAASDSSSAEFSLTLVRDLVESWIPLEYSTPDNHRHPQPLQLFPTPSNTCESITPESLYVNSKKVAGKLERKAVAIKRQVELGLLAKSEREEERLTAELKGMYFVGGVMEESVCEVKQSRKKRGSVMDEYLNKTKRNK